MHRLSSRLLAFLLVLSVLFSDCATNPVTGKREISLISEEQEIQMGQQYDPQVVAEFGLYEDDRLQQYIREKGNAMAAISERPNLPWTFRLVDSPVVNAFAVPGGFVYFTRGIMAHFNNEAQFAGVLGHEIGHVTARHSVAQQSKQQLLGGAAMLGMVLSPELASQGQTLMQGLQLLFLKYGRDDERQSDELGVKYSTAVGYNAEEMAGFFSTLDRLSGGAENRVPSFLSTHPDPANRETRVRQLAEEAQATDNTVNYEVGRDDYLRRIEGIVYGDDPNQGYIEGDAFYHPQLKFQFDIPRGWKLINSPTMVQMVAPDQNAVIRFQLAEGNDPAAAAQQFVQQNNVQVADQNNASINGLPATVILGDVVQTNQQSGQSQTLRTVTGFVAYGGNLYIMSGLAAARGYNRYGRDMEGAIRSFAELNDASKLNRQPERIEIYTVPQATTLQQALLDSGIPQSRLEEFSVLNGMELNTQVPAGYLIKSVTS